MRLGVIADVHGNRHALTAVLGEIRRLGVDQIVCAGDLVGWGAEPNACVELMAEQAGAAVIAGNHELIVLGRLSDERCSSLARRTQAWTREVLSPEARAWLSDLPTRIDLGPAVVAHGSLTDAQEYVRTEDGARAQLDLLSREHPDAQTLVLGHTHLPWVFGQHDGTTARTSGTVAFRDGQRHLVNPGSVGQSRIRERTPLARFAVIDTEARWVQLHQVAYDDAAARAAAASRGLPPEAVHAPPHSPLRLLRRVRDEAVRRAPATRDRSSR